MTIKVLIADDHQIMREGLGFMLEKEPGIKGVGEAKEGRTTLRLAREVGSGCDHYGRGAARFKLASGPLAKLLPSSLGSRLFQEKLKVRTIVELAKYAIREGLTAAMDKRLASLSSN